MPPYRALFFLSDLGGGGAQRTLLNLAEAMPPDLLRVELAVGHARGHARAWMPRRVEVECHDLEAGRALAAIPGLARLLGRLKPDALVSTMVHANIAAMAAARMAGGQAAVVLRETNPHRPQSALPGYQKLLAGLAYRRADLVIALSEGVRLELLEDKRLRPERTVTIANPVEVTAIAARVEAARREPSPWTGQGPRVLSIGRLVRQKGHDVLVEAVAAHAPAAHLAILGEGPDRAALATRAARLGVRLAMPGFAADTAAWLAHADVFALSSRWEGFGHVIVEAMAAGLPVVATDCPHGPADIVEDGLTGLLVPPEDAGALGAALARVLGDTSLARRLAAAGRQSADRFESARIARLYADALRAAIDRRRGAH